MRPARPDDAAIGAHLILLSGPEAASYGLALPPEATQRLLAELWPHPGHLFSYQWGYVAAAGGAVQGLLVAYPAATMLGAELATGRLLLRRVGLRQVLRMAWHGSTLMQVMAPVARDDFYIGHLAVLPEARGRGLGTQLLALAEGLAREAGCRRLALDAFIENERARALYVRVGYRVEQVARSRRLQRATGYSGLVRLVKPLS
ncbi:MAG TPA: GNAT family N-acetyltransferase [Anaerolineae bacterium]|nr:GNAT family N-acetyltransferase [Anaerolineae bacterium]HOQ99223.1 GNAT family N-acetyltransferase [Anaerolineae bacterium]HPL30430.1 GNAT family N-acetyltransferase [Anaerolineae bacterium]